MLTGVKWAAEQGMGWEQQLVYDVVGGWGSWEMGMERSQNDEDRARGVTSDSGKSEERTDTWTDQMAFIQPTAPLPLPTSSELLLPLPGREFLTSRGDALFVLLCSGPRRAHGEGGGPGLWQTLRHGVEPEPK